MGRRKCKPLDSRRAILEGWRLQFNLRAAPLFEPAMANITPIRGKPWKTDFGSVHGMAYLLTREDWMKVFRTEGGGRRGGYVPTYVQLKSYEGEILDAVTLSVPTYDNINQPPSLRYWKLIVEGAEQSKLDPKYIEWLKSIPYFDRNSLRQKHFGVWLFSRLYMYLILPILLIGVGIPGFGFRSLLYNVPLPPWLKEILAFPTDAWFNLITSIVWKIYDGIMYLVSEETKRATGIGLF